jgi:hypothetical protein
MRFLYYAHCIKGTVSRGNMPVDVNLFAEHASQAGMGSRTSPTQAVSTVDGLDILPIWKSNLMASDVLKRATAPSASATASSSESGTRHMAVTMPALALEM